MAEEKVKEEIVCNKCHKPMQKEQNYYTSRRDDLYPGGWVDECKKCFTMHINIREPSSFLTLLEKIDVPYIKSEWDSIVEKHGNNPKTTSTAIFGRYIAKMKLKQFSKYKFIDTAKFVEAEEMKKLQEKSMKLAEINKYRDALNNGEVVKNIDELNLDLSVLTEDEIKSLLKKPEELFDPSEYIDDISDELTREDKQYLLLKWGKTYTISECIKLEKLYNEMMESYDIRTASHIDYLLKICRISLKIDQALECNDIDGFQKMTKVYDLLMKSAKFTAVQNKELSSDYTDSVGIIVAMCEEEGFIPKLHIERQDIVDITLNDMNNYLRRLVMNEMNLGNMIEIYLQKMEQEENKEEDVIDENEDDSIILITEKEEALLEDQDFEDYNSMIEEEAELDEELLKKSGDLIDR